MTAAKMSLCFCIQLDVSSSLPFINRYLRSPPLETVPIPSSAAIPHTCTAQQHTHFHLHGAPSTRLAPAQSGFKTCVLNILRRTALGLHSFSQKLPTPEQPPGSRPGEFTRRWQPRSDRPRARGVLRCRRAVADPRRGTVAWVVSEHLKKDRMGLMAQPQQTSATAAPHVPVQSAYPRLPPQHPVPAWCSLHGKALRRLLRTLSSSVHGLPPPAGPLLTSSSSAHLTQPA